MRLLAFPIALFAGAILAIEPLSAQTISPVAVKITNTLGPVSSCPVTVNFSAAITVSNFSAGAAQEIQYKWLNSSGQDAPSQTLVVTTTSGGSASQGATTGGATTHGPTTGGATTHGPTSTAPVTVTATGAWTVGAGTYWEELQISYPVNLTSPHVNFVVTCPTPGSLTLQTNLAPLTIGAPKL
jgi:hypothetical protein